MIVTVHHTHFYHWKPVPFKWVQAAADYVPTQQEQDEEVYVNTDGKWYHRETTYTPTHEEQVAHAYKPSANGGWLKRVTTQVTQAGVGDHTSINIPASEIADAEAAAKAKGKAFNKRLWLAWYIDEIIMRHHAPGEAHTKVEVHDDPELEKMLNLLLVQDRSQVPTGTDVGVGKVIASSVGESIAAPTAETKSKGGGASGQKKARPFQRKSKGAQKKARPFQREAGRNFGQSTHGRVMGPPGREGTHSHFLTEVWRDGRCLEARPLRHNLTTDTASGFTNRRDWQSKLMGGGATAFFGANASGFATATSATSLTQSGATFPTTGQGLAGCIVAVGRDNTGAGGWWLGMIQSNTATVLTVDQWYDPTTGAASTTPNSTAGYTIIPGNMPAMWLALSTDGTAASSADTTLASELSSNGFSRALGAFAHTAAATTYTLSKTFTASGTDTINKEAVFGSAVLNKGPMPFESLEPNAPTLVSGDTLAQTVTITIN